MKKTNLFNLLNHIPSFLSFRIVRKMITLNYQIPENITFKLASTRKEYEQAFSIVYERYNELTYIDECNSELSFSKIHLLPVTSILVVKEHDEVIAVMSIVLDSGLGLPLESGWDISKERASSHRIAEVGSLVISSKVEKRLKGLIFLPLSAFMYRVCVDLLGIDKIIIATSKKASIFYKAILLFKSLGEGKYSRVKGRESECQFLDFKKAHTKYKKVYGNKKAKKNFYNFMVNHYFKEFELPDQSMSSLLNRGLSIEDINYFLEKKSGLFSDLSKIEKLYISSNYKNFTFSGSHKKGDEPSSERDVHRYMVKFSIKKIDDSIVETDSSFVLDASRGGVKISFSEMDQKQGKFKITLCTPHHGEISLEVETVWNHSSKMGLKILNSNNIKWNFLMDDLEREINGDIMDVNIAA
jgi:hypothetical protein